MLPEVGGLEYLVIAVVALIVVGPKDLPVMLRTLGQWVGRLRSMAAEFRASFDEMARQSELDDLRREVEAMRKGQLADQLSRDASSPEVSQIFSEIGDSLQGSDVQFHPPMSYQIETPPEPAPAAEPEAPAAPKPARKPRAKAASAQGAGTKPAAKAPAKRAAPRKPAKPKAGSPA